MAKRTFKPVPGKPKREWTNNKFGGWDATHKEYTQRNREVKQLLGKDHSYSDFEHAVLKKSQKPKMFGRGTKTVYHHVGYYTPARPHSATKKGHVHF